MVLEICENESSERISLRRGLYFTSWGFSLRRGLSPRLLRILPPSRKFPQASEDFTTEVEIPSGKQQKATNYIYTPLPPNDPIRSRYRTRLSVRNPAFCNAYLLAPSPDDSSSSPFDSWVLALGDLNLRYYVVSACLQPQPVPCT